MINFPPWSRGEGTFSAMMSELFNSPIPSIIPHQPPKDQTLMILIWVDLFLLDGKGGINDGIKIAWPKFLCFLKQFWSWYSKMICMLLFENTCTNYGIWSCVVKLIKKFLYALMKYNVLGIQFNLVNKKGEPWLIYVCSLFCFYDLLLPCVDFLNLNGGTCNVGWMIHEWKLSISFESFQIEVEIVPKWILSCKFNISLPSSKREKLL